MRKQLLALAVVAIIAGAFLYENQANTNSAFEQWKAEYGVNWSAEEDLYRRNIFEQNVVAIEKHNADHTQTYKMGINQFTPYTQQQFIETYLSNMIVPSDAVASEDLSSNIVGADIDWVAKGVVSPIKNQGQCGSCWAFSATGVLESFARQNGQSVSLSEQQLVDCSGSYGNQGCNGGWPSSALKYVIAKGIASEAEYPYVARTQSCKKDGGSFKVGSQTALSGCSGLQNGIQSRPISVTVDARNWSPYRSGVFSNCGSGIDHAVLLVGIVDGNWKIKNSWGTSWGEQGYIRLASGNTCGVCVYAGVYGH